MYRSSTSLASFTYMICPAVEAAVGPAHPLHALPCGLAAGLQGPAALEGGRYGRALRGAQGATALRRHWEQGFGSKAVEDRGATQAKCSRKAVERPLFSHVSRPRGGEKGAMERGGSESSSELEPDWSWPLCEEDGAQSLGEIASKRLKRAVKWPLRSAFKANSSM